MMDVVRIRSMVDGVEVVGGAGRRFKKNRDSRVCLALYAPYRCGTFVGEYAVIEFRTRLASCEKIMHVSLFEHAKNM